MLHAPQQSFSLPGVSSGKALLLPLPGSAAQLGVPGGPWQCWHRPAESGDLGAPPGQVGLLCAGRQAAPASLSRGWVQDLMCQTQPSRARASIHQGGQCQLPLTRSTAAAVSLLSQSAGPDVSLLCQSAGPDVSPLSQTAGPDVSLLSQSAAPTSPHPTWDSSARPLPWSTASPGAPRAIETALPADTKCLSCGCVLQGCSRISWGVWVRWQDPSLQSCSWPRAHGPCLPLEAVGKAAHTNPQSV